MFFIASAAFCCVKSWENTTLSELNTRQSHSNLWSALSGFCLACAVSVKFVGLFTVAWIGIYTIYQLLQLWQNLPKCTLHQFAIVLLLRALTLILLPLGVYCSFFVIHFLSLNKSGTGDTAYNSRFQVRKCPKFRIKLSTTNLKYYRPNLFHQVSLAGNFLNSAMVPEILYDHSLITLKSTDGNAKYLHSIDTNYGLKHSVDGHPHQQVFFANDKNYNKRWTLRLYSTETLEKGGQNLRPIRNGDLVELIHVPTRKYLIVGRTSAPITREHFQVF